MVSDLTLSPELTQAMAMTPNGPKYVERLMANLRDLKADAERKASVEWIKKYQVETGDAF